MGSERKRRAQAEHVLEDTRGTVGLKERELASKENMQTLLDEQKAVLEHAAAIIKDAGIQLGVFTREEVTPKVRDTMTHHVKPLLAGGVASATLASSTVKNKIKGEVLPALSGAVDRASNLGKKLSKEIKHEAASSKAELWARKLGLAAAPKPAPAPAPGPGRYILLGVGVVAVAGLVYAVWQTLRADDDLWIEDEPEALDEDLSIEPESNAPASNI